jgi:hypothetical protein
MSWKNIFEFNPMTAIYLTGYATHLYLLICYNQQKLNNIAISPELLDFSSKRIKRWNTIFLTFCMSHYEIHLLDHEKEVLEKSQPKESGDVIDPFLVHSNLIISASQTMVNALAGRVLTDSIFLDVITQRKISSWFSIIEQVVINESSVNKYFNQESIDKLKGFIYQIEQRNDPTTHSMASTFPHFSPGALFIRTSFIVHTQKLKMDKNLFARWELFNAKTISNCISVDKFLAKKHTSKNDLEFPYIHQLPRASLRYLWDGFDEVQVPVPVGDLFHEISSCIFHYGIQYQKSQTNNNAMMDSYDFIADYQHLKEALFELIKKEAKSVKNNEKQKKFQMKKNGEKRKRSCNGYDSMVTSLFNNDTMLFFLFGLTNQIIQDHPNSIETTNKFAC